jgi:ATP synthase protein I
MRAASYSTVGLELVLSVLFGFFGGRWLDGKFGTDPALALVGLVFGAAAGFRSLFRAARRMTDDSEHDGFRGADVGRSARFAMSERMAASRARRAALRESSHEKPERERA